MSNEDECSKCGSMEIEIVYTPSCPIGQGFSIPEHMRKSCQTCGYVWTEKPKDAE